MVTNTNDAGSGSLRQAILDSNATMDVNTIDFAIPGTGVQTIVAQSPLPLISQPVAIDGYSQPGASANTAPPGSGFNSVLLIQITGSPLLVDAGNSGVFPAMVVSGLVVEEIQCGLQSDGAIISGNYVGTDASGSVSNGGRIIVVSTSGVHIGPGNVTPAISVGPGGNGTLISGNFIGINAAGNAALADPTAGAGIQVSDSTAVIIGGATPADRNVIDTGDKGVDAGDGADQIQILGNYIGTDASGTKPIGNLIGVIVETGEGTSATVRGNVVSGNSDGIEVADVGKPVLAVIQGNFIGTDETATLDLGNADFGILVAANSVLIGGTGPGEGNVIAFNQNRILSFAALEVTGSLVTIRGNRIFNNAYLGLDLAEPVGNIDTITVNDPQDVDTGPNGLQNFPLITSIVPGSSTTHIEGRLNSMPSSAYSIDLFSNPACVRRPRAPLEAETYLGAVDVATDGFGNATFAVDVPVVLSPGQLVTATATDSLGNTSELSQRIVFTVSPLAGPAGQTTAVTVKGMEFEAGSTVTVGGVPATNVTATSPTTITATMPAFPAGTLHDVTVSTPSGLSSTLPNGWMTDFSDMPAHQSVSRLRRPSGDQRRRRRRRRWKLWRAKVRPCVSRWPSSCSRAGMARAIRLRRVRASSATCRAPIRLPRGSRRWRRRASPQDAAAAISAPRSPCFASRWPCSCSRPNTAPHSFRRPAPDTSSSTSRVRPSTRTGSRRSPTKGSPAAAALAFTALWIPSCASRWPSS